MAKVLRDLPVEFFDERRERFFVCERELSG
jgi:hypothetical protein